MMFPVKAQEEGIIYSLPGETVFDGTNNIDTGIYLYRDYSDFTLFVDFTVNLDDITTTWPSVQETAITCMYEIEPWPGFVVRTVYVRSYRSKLVQTIFGNSSEIIEPLTSDMSHCKVAFSVTNKRCKLFFYSIDGEVIQKTANDSTSQSNIDKAVLTIGSYRTPQGTYGRYWKGTMHELTVYDRAFSEEELRAILEGGGTV